MPFPTISLKSLICILSKLLPESQTSRIASPQGWWQSFQRQGRPAGADCAFSLWLAPGHLCFLEGVCAPVWHLGFCGCHLEDAPFECLAQVANGSSDCRSHKMWQTFLNWLPAPSPPHPPTQGSVLELREMLTSQPSSGRILFAYHKSCCLRVHLPISLHLAMTLILSFGTLTGLDKASPTENY